MTADATQTMGFQTEAKRLLHLMIHSLYSNREIFLRELISNASDAIDKHRFAVISDGSLASGADYRIRVSAEADAKTITIDDNVLVCPAMKWWTIWAPSPNLARPLSWSN